MRLHVAVLLITLAVANAYPNEVKTEAKYDCPMQDTGFVSGDNYIVDIAAGFDWHTCAGYCVMKRYQDCAFWTYWLDDSNGVGHCYLFNADVGTESKPGWISGAAGCGV